MYEHRKPTIGRGMITPDSTEKKPSKPIEDNKPVCEQPVKKPECKPVTDKKPIQDKKPVKEEKKRIDPWSRLLFGPTRSAKPVQTQPTEDKKAEQRPGFWWI